MLVDAALAADLVVARAAGEEVARLAADDEVVAGAAVGGDADGRAGSGRAVQRARRTGREASMMSLPLLSYGFGEPEDPLVVLVLGVGDVRERVERLRAELHAERVAGRTGVPDAVLRRVAVDDERRARAGGVGLVARDGVVDGPSPSAAIEQSDRRTVADGQDVAADHDVARLPELVVAGHREDRRDPRSRRRRRRGGRSARRAVLAKISSVAVDAPTIVNGRRSRRRVTCMPTLNPSVIQLPARAHEARAVHLRPGRPRRP